MDCSVWSYAGGDDGTAGKAAPLATWNVLFGNVDVTGSLLDGALVVADLTGGRKDSAADAKDEFLDRVKCEE
jgi:hypothetical protein